MLLLTIFAFLAGVVTILSPCILPLLPIILSSVDGTGRQKPTGVVVGFVASFTFFTLFLSTIVKLSGIPSESLRFLSIVVIALFGASLLIPQVQLYTERLFSRLSALMPSRQQKPGFWGGVVIGLSLGLLWTPCVGPILASVISLAITGTVTAQAFVITFAYALGTAIPMFGIMLAGSSALNKVPWLVKNTGNIQKIFGVLMVLTAIAIYFNLDRRFQTFVLTALPSYGTGLTQFEDSNAIKRELEKVSKKTMQDLTMTNQTVGKILPQGPVAPEIIPGGKWLNSDPLTLAQLKGKVVLLDFWTYTCINCQRTLPYLQKWHETYSDKGLAVIGVHAPEFEFEKDSENVQQAIEDFKLTYATVQDNDFATWRAYENRYWPAKYLIDAEGYVRYTHFGEGAYDETEKVIQQLLAEAGASDVTSQVDNATYRINSKTPELYLGFERMQNFSSPESIVENALTIYSAPASLRNNQLAFVGNWSVRDEYANPQQGAELLLNFDAKEVFLVMRNTGAPAKVSVSVDSEQQYLGEDAAEGVVTVDSDRLYKLINLQTPGRHILKLKFQDGNAQLFAFTFG